MFATLPHRPARGPRGHARRQHPRRLPGQGRQPTGTGCRVWAGVGLCRRALGAASAGCSPTPRPRCWPTTGRASCSRRSPPSLAVVFVTWMIFWMRRAARSTRRASCAAGSRRRARASARSPSPVIAFLAVVREGLETALLFYAAAQGASTRQQPAARASRAASLTAVRHRRRLLYASAIRINLPKFFTWTGVLLVLVAAGILKYGVHDFQEAGVLPGPEQPRVRHLRRPRPEQLVRRRCSPACSTSPPAPTVLEMIAWVAYVVPVLFLLPPAAAAPAGRRRPEPPRPRGALAARHL